MKAILLSFTIAAFAVASFANPIERQRAETLALQYRVPGYSMKQVHAIISKEASGANVSAAVPYYIFSRGENQGYVIVSGDDCLPEILGYAERGNFEEEQLPPALKSMLASWQELVEKAQADQTNVPLSVIQRPTVMAANRQNISPLTTSHWHQTGPYNDLCPNRDDNGAKSMTGCVATAISQILYYWRADLPSTLQATTPTYGMDGYSHASVTLSLPKGTPLKWELMLDSYNGTPAEYNEAVATLVYAVGTASHLEYSVEGGTATSGHIEDIPAAISNYFGMNGGWVAYRTNYSQEAWTQLIYDELAKGRPVMYTGVHETSGGHAVYVDGYQKSNDLMHFNFGWGGQGDGYYTTTLETGMNHFNGYQSCLINAFPKKWNLKTTISLPAHAYVKVDTPLKVTVENHSTLDFSGLYCFLATNANKPTQLSAAKSFDDTSVIPHGGKGILTFNAKPTSAGTWYVTITDKSLNVLAQRTIEVEKADAQLSLSSIEVFGSSESEEVGGQAYARIYNTKATVSACVRNSSDAAYGGTATINLYASSDNGATFEKVNSFSTANAYIDAQSEQCLTFTVTGLEPGLLYYVESAPEWGTTLNSIAIENATASRTCFLSAGASDLTATLNGNVLCYSGHWDATTFSTIAKRSANKSAIAYDLTEVIGTGFVPETEFPAANALIYASGKACGTNVIVSNTASGPLTLTAGHDLITDADITIHGAAQLDINQEPACWYQTTVPFDCEVPDGILAREVTGHVNSTLGINGKTDNVTSLQGGRNYLIMTSSRQRQTLASSGSDNLLPQVPGLNRDNAFIGVYAATETPSGAKVIREKDTDLQYFMSANSEPVSGLRGYFYDPSATTSIPDFRAFSDIMLDPVYLELAKRIQMMYDVREKMAGIASSKQRCDMNDSIAKAEKIFSSRSLSDATAVRNYTSSLETWIANYETMAGDGGEDGCDMTSLIDNPSFESSTTNVKGWVVEAGGNAVIRKNSNLVYKTVHGDGSNFLYSSNGSMVSQTLSLAPGYYRLMAMLGSDEDNTITLFAGEQATTVSAHPFGKHYLTEARIDDIKVDETGKLTIGVKAGNWYNADNFRLVFTGELESDAIAEVSADIDYSASSTGIFTLQGQPVAGITQSGFYIVNGKKVVIRK